MEAAGSSAQTTGQTCLICLPGAGAGPWPGSVTGPEAGQDTAAPAWLTQCRGVGVGGWRGWRLLVPGRTWEAGLRLQTPEVGGLCRDSLPPPPPRSSAPSAAPPPPRRGALPQPPLWLDNGRWPPRARSGWRAAVPFHCCVLGTCSPGRGQAPSGHETRPPAPSGVSEQGAQGDLSAGPPPTRPPRHEMLAGKLV